MSRLIPITVAAAAVVPFIGLVLYLILRTNPERATAEQEEVTTGVDVLAEREDAEFAEAAEALRERNCREAENRMQFAKADDDEIAWSESETPFRPPSVDPGVLFDQIKLAKPPKIARGEHHVFISRCAMEKIEANLRSDTTVELGGLLVGQPYYAPPVDAYLVVVHDAYSADGGIETAVSFEYTAETWRAMTPLLQEMPADHVVVGSYHSHPGLGVFLSSTDIDTQVSVFSQPWQLALVIDPIRNETGFFISPEGVPAQYDVF